MSVSPTLKGGKRFRNPAPTQRAVIRLLEESPLPWTRRMLVEWFGMKSYGGPLLEAIVNRRIVRLAPGIYTAWSRCSKHYLKPIEQPRRNMTFSPRQVGDVVTDDMLARYGYNL